MSDWFSIEQTDAGALLRLRGTWRIDVLDEIVRELEESGALQSSDWILECRELSSIDTAGAMALLQFLRECGADSSSVEVRDCSEAQRSIFELTGKSLDTPLPLRKKPEIGWLPGLGRDTIDLLDTVKSILGLVGQTAVACVQSALRPHQFRYREFAVQLEAVGYRAVPIVALVTFLIGIVVAYLSGVQLEQYGANIILVDGVGLGVTRELSPILAAIIVAGRSGSAFTAQLGTMKLNEEVDAMTTLGLSPVQVLVLPRILALMLALPLLVFVGDVAGIVGAMVIADLRLNVTMATFVERLHVVLPMKHVIVGMVKAPVFALFIATIGCHLGLNVESNARSVGINTTRTVVRSIVAVILLNAAFAIVFSELGI